MDKVTKEAANFALDELDGSDFSAIRDHAKTLRLYIAAAEQRGMERAAAKVLDVRVANAGNFERSGAVWEAYDKAVLDCHAAICNTKEA